MSADGPLTLRWHEFSSNMAGTSAAFRTREAFTDLTLVVENSKVHVHRFILASCSAVFLELLEHSEHPHPLVYLRGVQQRHLAALLDFMYLGEVSVEQEELAGFLRTAEELQVKGLTEGSGVGGQEAQPALEAGRLGGRDTPCEEITPLRMRVEEKTGGGSERKTKGGSGSKADGGSDRRRGGVKDSGSRGRKVEDLGRKEKKVEEVGRKGRELVVSEREVAVSPEPSKRQKKGRKQRDEEEVVDGFSPPLPDVFEQQKKVSGMIRSAITAAEEEIEELESHGSGSLPALTDATDDTISEVEKMLRETKEILGMDQERQVVDISGNRPEVVPAGSPQASSDVSKGKSSSQKRAAADPAPQEKQQIKAQKVGKAATTASSRKPTSQAKPYQRHVVPNGSPHLASPRLASPSVASSPMASPRLASPSSPLTPAKVFQPSDKDRQVIACLVAKLTGSQGWRCTMCRQTFSSKAETEEHVGVSHVQGQLT